MRAVLMAGGSGTRLRPLNLRFTETHGASTKPTHRRTYH